MSRQRAQQELPLDWRDEIIDIHKRAIKPKGIRPGSDEDIRFLALALAGEAGEIANLIKKSWRGDFELTEVLDDLEGEIADVAIYLYVLADMCHLDVDEAVERKLPEVRRKFPRARRSRRQSFPQGRFDRERQ